TTPSFHRTAPFWYYLPILPVAAFPWIVPALARVRQCRALWDARRAPHAREPLLFASWVIVPLLFLTVNQSKLPQYLLPLMPVFALAAARNIVAGGLQAGWRAYAAAGVALGVARPRSGTGDGAGDPRLPALAALLSGADGRRRDRHGGRADEHVHRRPPRAIPHDDGVTAAPRRLLARGAGTLPGAHSVRGDRSEPRSPLDACRCAPAPRRRWPLRRVRSLHPRPRPRPHAYPLPAARAGGAGETGGAAAEAARPLSAPRRGCGGLSAGMCGIFGAVSLTRRPLRHPGCLRAMAAALAHRGPDGERIVGHERAGVGARRLAIMDLTTGDQPFQSPDRSVWMVCNGEIYNAPALRRECAAAGYPF